jgi:hypothetical protein
MRRKVSRAASTSEVILDFYTAIGTLPLMLFMVIERFKNQDPGPVGERFQQSGRMMPEGVVYHASWVDAAEARCFQVMEAPDRELLDAWICRWEDLVDFEVIPVVRSSDFWTKG